MVGFSTRMDNSARGPRKYRAFKTQSREERERAERIHQQREAEKEEQMKLAAEEQRKAEELEKQQKEQIKHKREQEQKIYEQHQTALTLAWDKLMLFMLAFWQYTFKYAISER